MRQSKWANIYALLCTVAMAIGAVAVFVCAWGEVATLLNVLIGFVLGAILAPVVHEFGHILFAICQKMRIIYAKFFCFRLQRKGKKLQFGFASPFAADETQVIPKFGANMQSRAIAYTLGGLLFSGIFLVLLLLTAVVLSALKINAFLLWGALPYCAYLFFLNLAPFEYTAGKTDMLVFIGLKRGYDVEKTMLAAMKIQGYLFEGKSFSEISRDLFFELPVLREDEPLFALMLDLRYRYHLEKGEMDEAADCLNRLVVSQEYLSEYEVERIAAECVYMHALRGDYQRAEESGVLCKSYLKSEEAAAKRILAAYSLAFGKADAVQPLKAQAEECLKNEGIKGIAKFERILLSRIDVA